VFVWTCVKERKGFDLVWLGLCKEGRVLGGEWDHLSTRSEFNQGPSLVVPSVLWSRGFEQDFTTGGWGVNCGSPGQYSQVVGGRARQSSVRALTYTCRQSSGVVRVLDVRIDWNVKRSTTNKVKRRAVRSQTGGGLTGRRHRSSARTCVHSICDSCFRRLVLPFPPFVDHLLIF